jgi:virginiamycin B lyase
MDEISRGDRGAVRRRFVLVAVVTGIALLAACGSGPSARTYLFWADSASAIGRADLNGTGANQSFISTGGTLPYMVAASPGYLYWTNLLNGTIGRAAINGTGVSERFITGASRPVGVAVSSRYIYWSDNETGTIGRANLDGTGVNQRFITGAIGPTDLAAGSGYIYWTNPSTGTIGRADIDGTAADQRFITVQPGRPFGVTLIPGS